MQREQSTVDLESDSKDVLFCSVEALFPAGPSA